jgi:hypothetical protein
MNRISGAKNKSMAIESMNHEGFINSQTYRMDLFFYLLLYCKTALNNDAL